MPSIHPEDQCGPSPRWNLLGFGLAALAVALFVAVFVPPAPVADDSDTPTTRAGRTITLAELEAMLTDEVTPPGTVQVETPEGPLTVVVPPSSEPTTTTTTTAPRPVPTTTSTTSTTTTTTTVPRSPRDPVAVGANILDDLLGGRASPPVTLPEVVGDGR